MNSSESEVQCLTCYKSGKGNMFIQDEITETSKNTGKIKTLNTEVYAK